MARFIILMYHMISERRSERERKYACPPPRFAKHMRFLHDKGFNLITLDAVQKYLDGGVSIPPRCVSVTLDDGFRDNYENAFPILGEYSIPATIFLTTGFVGSTNASMESRGFPRREMLSWREVAEMNKAGVCFGAHTMTHPRLPEMPTEQAHNEISESKRIIEDRLACSVDFFAYPYGLFTDETQALVKEAGFSLACSTRSGFNNCHTDPYALHRIEVNGTDSVWQLSMKLSFGVNEAPLSLPLRYYFGRLIARLRK